MLVLQDIFYNLPTPGKHRFALKIEVCSQVGTDGQVLADNDLFNHIRIEIVPAKLQAPQLKTGQVSLGLSRLAEAEQVVISRALEEHQINGVGLGVFGSDAEVVGLVAELEQEVKALRASCQI